MLGKQDANDLHSSYRNRFQMIFCDNETINDSYFFCAKKEMTNYFNNSDNRARPYFPQREKEMMTMMMMMMMMMMTTEPQVISQHSIKNSIYFYASSKFANLRSQL